MKDGIIRKSVRKSASVTVTAAEMATGATMEAGRLTLVGAATVASGVAAAAAYTADVAMRGAGGISSGQEKLAAKAESARGAVNKWLEETEVDLEAQAATAGIRAHVAAATAEAADMLKGASENLQGPQQAPA